MKLTARQHDVLTRMVEGGVLFVSLEPGATGMEQRCWIGAVEVLPMTANALIAARLVERDRAFRTGGGLRASYVVSPAGRAALNLS
jgi:hypothetical protein